MKFVNNVKFELASALEWVVVTVTLLNGLYIFSPLYQYSRAVNGLTPFAFALSHPVLIFIWMGLLVISALALAYGLYKNKPKWRSAALFGQFSLRFYNVLTTILVAGFLPLTWLASLTVVVFCVILWVYERIKQNRVT